MHMEGWRLLLAVVLWTTVWSIRQGETANQVPEVSCVITEPCVLPCSCRGGGFTWVEWLNKNGSMIHDYQVKNDTKSKRNASYRGRTSMFHEEIPRGNCSIRLSPVKVQDQGTYMCQMPRAGDVFVKLIELRVEAPVVSVLIKETPDALICTSERIYPQPSVSWTPNSKHHTQVKPTDELLFSIWSSLTVEPRPPQHYTCNISTSHRWKSATYSLHYPVKMSATVTMPCIDPEVPVDRVERVQWTFNYTSTIGIRRGADVTFTDTWRSHVGNISESGSLILQNLSSVHEGVYQCELHTRTHSYFSRTELKNTVPSEHRWVRGLLIGAMVMAILLCVITFVIIYMVIRTSRNEPQTLDSDAIPLFFKDIRS